MKCEFLEQISVTDPNDAILRLFAFEANDLVDLVGLIDRLLSSGVPVSLDAIRGLEILNCSLVLRIGQTDKGISGMAMNLVCEMTKEGFLVMRERIKSYSEHIGQGAYQWLYDCTCEVDFLLSQTGDW